MDDVTLGGPAATFASDVAMIKAEGASHGLFLNDQKCESITANGQPPDDALLRDFIYTTYATSATLLGALLVIGPAMDKCLQQYNAATISKEQSHGRNSSHDALVLLYVLRSAHLPCTYTKIITVC